MKERAAHDFMCIIWKFFIDLGIKQPASQRSFVSFCFAKLSKSLELSAEKNRTRTDEDTLQGLTFWFSFLLYYMQTLVDELATILTKNSR